MIRLICTDVDGTLVGSGSAIHPSVWVAAEKARAAGIHLAICSGRPGFGLTRGLAERLNADGWHCFQNGASVVHLPTGRSLSAHLTPDIVSMLVTRARADGRILELYSDDDYVVESTAELAREHARLLGVPFVSRPFESLAPPIVRGQWLLPEADAARVLAEPHPGLLVSPSTSPAMPNFYFVNLTPSGIDKATAMRAIAGEYDVQMRDVMFVGDGWNDVTAMEAVGFPVAMANAEREALAVARHVVGHVDDGGLADALALAMSGLDP